MAHEHRCEGHRRNPRKLNSATFKTHLAKQVRVFKSHISRIKGDNHLLVSTDTEKGIWQHLTTIKDLRTETEHARKKRLLQFDKESLEKLS